MLEEMMLEKKVWAVVGANDDRSKFGNRIFRKLQEAGYRVYPINPKCSVVEGAACYKDLSSLPEVPEVIDMVVNPQRGRAFIDEASKLGIRNIWLQPGTYNDELMEQIGNLGLTAVQACVLVALI